MSRSNLYLSFTALGALTALTSACSEPRCPSGFIKMGDICHHQGDSGQAVLVGDGAVQDEEEPHDAGSHEAEADSARDDASTSTHDAASDASVILDASSEASTSQSSEASTPQGSDAAPETAVADSGSDATSAPLPECDNTRPCGAGYVCNSAMKCVSACTQTQCDPNATCSLVSNAPVCACNGGFTSTTGTGGAVTCLRNLACDELGCDVQNAECVGSTTTLHCVCKNGYTGDGKTCAPVSCPTPTLTNGTVAAPDGLTLDKTATYQCNAGYDLPNGVASITRTCGADKTWGSAVPNCVPKNCGPLSISFGTADTSRGTTYGSPAISFICQSGFVLSGPSTVTCQVNGTWSTAPTCLGCGDGLVSNIPGLIQEQCDLTAPMSSPWACKTTCQPDTAKIYRPCSTGSECDTGGGQACLAGVCGVIGCVSSTACPTTPAGSGSNPTCFALSSNTAFCTAGCTTASQCAPGLTCSNGVCQGCDTTSRPCQNGQRCTPYASTGLGRCTQL